MQLLHSSNDNNNSNNNNNINLKTNIHKMLGRLYITHI